MQITSVHFTPGARTAWHTHPNGQTIYVTEGIGLCQRQGGPLELIGPGDRVFFEPACLTTPGIALSSVMRSRDSTDTEVASSCSADPLEQLAWRGELEAAGEDDDGLQPRGALAALEQADLGAVQVAEVCERLL